MTYTVGLVPRCGLSQSLCVAGNGFPAIAAASPYHPGMHQPSLWFDGDDVAKVRQRRQDGHALTRRILDRCHAGDSSGKDLVGALAARALAESDRVVAEQLADHLLDQQAHAQDLGLAHRCLQLAVAHECCAGLWDDDRLAAIRTAAGELVDCLRHGVSSQNPHAVQNNWWGVTHGGLLLASLIADREEDARWAAGRCRAFAQHFGPAGLYHEGLGYQLYTLSHLLPALVAGWRRGLIDLPGEFPWISRLSESLYAFTAPRPVVSDSSDAASGHGMMLSWNDAGLTWLSCNVSPLMLNCADPRRRPALAAWSLQLEAGPGDQAPLYGGWEGWPFALALPPDQWCSQQGEALPTHVCDHRQGLAVFRDRWQDGNDTLLGCYTRATHGGGHGHDDGGSVRLMALGQDWIIGGGQARGAAAWQSVLTPDDHTGRKAGLGAVIWDEATPTGGCFGMDLRKVSQAYHERYAALAGNSTLDVPAAVALLDVVDDHLNRGWTWRITHAPGLTASLDDDGAGFRLVTTDGTQAQFRFLGQIPTAIRHEQTPSSCRTFSNNVNIVYPTRPVIAATFPARPHLAVLVAVVISRGPAPLPTSAGGVDIRVGARLWQRPFSSAVPAAYDLLRAGTLARWADGLRGA